MLVPRLAAFASYTFSPVRSRNAFRSRPDGAVRESEREFYSFVTKSELRSIESELLHVEYCFGLSLAIKRSEVEGRLRRGHAARTWCAVCMAGRSTGSRALSSFRRSGERKIGQ